MEVFLAEIWHCIALVVKISTEDAVNGQKSIILDFKLAHLFVLLNFTSLHMMHDARCDCYFYNRADFIFLSYYGRK